MGIVFDKTSCYNATIKSSAITRGFLLFFHPRGTDAGLVSGMKLQPPASVAASNGDICCLSSKVEPLSCNQ